jgi:hypothetical protein
MKKSETKNINTGSVSKEHLHHFNCGSCKKWWSIGDAPKRKQWFCPWCGKKQEIYYN